MLRIIFRLIKQGLHSFFLYPFVQFCAFGAVVLLVFFAGLFLLAMNTLNHELGTAQGETVFQVYWRPGTDMTLVQEHWTQAKSLPWFRSLKTFSPSEALGELRERLRDEKFIAETDLSFLKGKNPLPATALIEFSPQEQDIEAWVEETKGYFLNMAGVERVVASPLRDELGQAWRKASRYVLWPSFLFLSLILGLLVGSTIRLAFFSQSGEIEILQLVGARNWYIRLPLLANAFFLSFFGSCIGLFLLWCMYWQIKDVLNFAPLFLEIHFLPLSVCLSLVGVSVCTALFTGYLAVRTPPVQAFSGSDT